MYEMLSGRPPFGGEFDEVILYSIMNEDPPALDKTLEELPEDLIKVVNRCLRKDAHNRYQGIEDFILDISSLNKDLTPLPGLSALKYFENITAPLSKKFWLIFAGFSIIFFSVIGYFIFIYLNPSSGIDSLNLQKYNWANSIAVLPVIDLYPDDDYQYLGEIITYHTIRILRKFQKLKVIDIETVIPYKDSKKNTQVIGTELEVKYLLRGSIGIYDNIIKVDLILEDTQDGSIFWSKIYEDDFQKMFTLYEDIAHTISDLLLDDNEVTKIAGDHIQSSDNFEASKNYLLAYYSYQSEITVYDSNNVLEPEELYKISIEKDSNYSLPYVGLARLYKDEYNLHSSTKEDSAKNLKLQKQYIRRALEINPLCAEANAVQGAIYDYQGEIDKAFKYYCKAFNLNPNTLECNEVLEQFYRARGLLKHALKFRKRVNELFGQHSGGIYQLAWYNLFLGRYEKSEHLFKKSLILDPTSIQTLSDYLELLIHVKKYDKAISVINSIYSLTSDNHLKLHLDALTCAIKGDKEKALSLIPQLTNNWIKVDIYHILGMNQEAIEPYLDQLSIGRRRHFVQHYFLNITTNDELKNDPRFEKLMEEDKRLYDIFLKKFGNIENFLN
jgi:TolB-like protein/Tfp pilus assembly protein PilF